MNDTHSPVDHLFETSRDGVLTITIDRAAKRNALSRAVLAGLGRRFRRHATDPALRLAVLTAAGDQCFAAGGDLHELESVRTETAAQDLTTAAATALDAIRAFPVPVVAALNGAALGGGAELALACDLRIAAPAATIGFLQAKLRLSPGFGGGADLARLVGASRALLLLARAEVLSAAAAEQAGLVDAVAAAGEPFEDFIAGFIAPLAANPPHVLRALKSIVHDERRALPRSLREANERRAFCSTWLHPDHWDATQQIRAAIRR